MVRGEINLDDYEEYLIEIDEESDADNDVDQKEEENLENLELNDNDDQLEMKPTTCPNDDNNIVKEVKFDDAIVTILPEPETIKERRESFVSQMNAIHESNIEPNSFRQQQQLAQLNTPLGPFFHESNERKKIRSFQLKKNFFFQSNKYSLVFFFV